MTMEYWIFMENSPFLEMMMFIDFRIKKPSSMTRGFSHGILQFFHSAWSTCRALGQRSSFSLAKAPWQNLGVLGVFRPILLWENPLENPSENPSDSPMMLWVGKYGGEIAIDCCWNSGENHPNKGGGCPASRLWWPKGNPEKSQAGQSKSTPWWWIR